jgi:integrase
MATDRLTDTEIKRAIASGKPAKLFDGGGLYLLIKPAKERGEPPAAYWRHKHYYAGIERLISHGVYPRVSLKRAREHRDALQALLEKKIDPSAHRRADKAARRKAAKSTFQVIAKEWYAKNAKKWAETHSSKVLGRLTADVYPFIGDKSISSLSTDDLMGVLERVQNRGAVETAHRIRQNMEAIFDFAKGKVLIVGENPTPKSELLEAPVKGSFASITDPKGVGALIRAIRGYQGQPVTRIALQLAPLLFVRPGELRAAEWQEMDLDRAEWRIPPERMKGRIAHFVPLPPQALALLRELHVLTGRGKFLFPSERGGHRPMSENTLNAALRGLGYSKEQMVAHGFRHMASTLLNESGKWHADAIERQMAHVPQNQVRATYNAAQHLPERKKMMTWWAVHLDELAADNKVASIGRKSA